MAAPKSTYPFYSPPPGDFRLAPSVAKGSGGSSSHGGRTSSQIYLGATVWALHRCGRVSRQLLRKRLLLVVLVVLGVMLVSLNRNNIDEAPYMKFIKSQDYGGDRPSLNVKENHAAKVSNKTLVATPTHKSRPKPTKKATIAPAKTTPWMNVTAAIGYFAKTYAHSYPDGDKFFTRVKTILQEKWKPSISHTQKFRNDIREALGPAGIPEKIYLTKKNTPRKARMTFYMAGKPQTISDTLWKTLPEDSVFAPGRFNICNVVGSSGLLKGSQCGTDIDSADFVVRFNIATVKGFERDVGSKTNFTSLNPTFIMSKLNSLRHKDNASLLAEKLRQFGGSYLYLPGFAVSGSLKLLMKTAQVTVESTNLKPIYGSPDHFVAVSTLLRKLLDSGKKWPSTGIYAVLSLINVCDRINIYGFWPFPKSLVGKTVPYHYNDDIKGTKVHNFDKEFKALMHFHEQGIINMQLRSCKK